MGKRSGRDAPAAQAPWKGPAGEARWAAVMRRAMAAKEAAAVGAEGARLDAALGRHPHATWEESQRALEAASAEMGAAAEKASGDERAELEEGAELLAKMAAEAKRRALQEEPSPIAGLAERAPKAKIEAFLESREAIGEPLGEAELKGAILGAARNRDPGALRAFAGSKADALEWKRAASDFRRLGVEAVEAIFAARQSPGWAGEVAWLMVDQPEAWAGPQSQARFARALMGFEAVAGAQKAGAWAFEACKTLIGEEHPGAARLAAVAAPLLSPAQAQALVALSEEAAAEPALLAMAQAGALAKAKAPKPGAGAKAAPAKKASGRKPA